MTTFEKTAKPYTLMQKENEAKYGPKNQDVIAQLAAIGDHAAFVFCLGNVAKYATRYTSQSQKSGLPEDLEKIQDYLRRAHAHCFVALEADLLALSSLPPDQLKSDALALIQRSYKMLNGRF